MTLGEPLDFADRHFGAVASAGAFGATHAPACGLDELIRVTRRGGHVVMTIRVKDMERTGFPAAIAAHEAAGRWRTVETVGPFEATRSEPESLYVAHVLEVP